MSQSPHVLLPWVSPETGSGRILSRMTKRVDPELQSLLDGLTSARLIVWNH